MRILRIVPVTMALIALVSCHPVIKIEGTTENPTAREYLEAAASYPDGNYEETVIERFDTLKTDFRKDQPFPLVVRWENKENLKATTLKVAEDKKMTKELFSQAITPGADSALLYNLIPGREYWFKVTGEAKGKEKLIARGTLRTDDPLRMIRTDALHNVRDMGGWPTADGRTMKYGLLFRGGQMNRQDPPTEADVDLLKRQLGIKADVDLRWDGELNGGTPDDPSDDLFYTPLGEGVEYAHLPVNMYDPVHADTTSWKKALNFLLDHIIAGEPCYIHCAAGADRTGTTCFLLEGLLGVTEQYLSNDYELTSFSIYGRRSRNGETGYKRMVTYMLSRDGETLRDKFENYFTEYAGISKEKIEAFRNAALD